MSIQAAAQFITTRVATTPALSLKLAAAIHGKTEAETSRIVSDLGRENGFDFNPEAARQARPMLLAVLKASDAPGGTTGPAVELSPEELDRVAGGMMDPEAAVRMATEAHAAGTVSITAWMNNGYSGQMAITALNRINTNFALRAELEAALNGQGGSGTSNNAGSGPVSGTGPGS